MERFFNEDPDKDNESFFGNNDDDDDDGIMEGEVIGFIDQQGILDAMHMDLQEIELNQNLLGRAIEIAESHWLWRFKSHATKLAEIEEIYHQLIKMTESQNAPQGEEDED